MKIKHNIVQYTVEYKIKDVFPCFFVRQTVLDICSGTMIQNITKLRLFFKMVLVKVKFGSDTEFFNKNRRVLRNNIAVSK